MWIYCAIGLITEAKRGNKQDQYIVILEWNEVIVNLMWVLSFRTDFKKVYLNVLGKPGKIMAEAEPALLPQ